MEHYHVFTKFGKTKKAKLPQGRWLKVGETVRPTDLVCWSNERFQKIGSLKDQSNYSYCTDNPVFMSKFIYRPTKTKYRILKIGEIIKESDEHLDCFTQKWTKTTLGGYTVESSNSYRRRIHRAS